MHIPTQKGYSFQVNNDFLYDEVNRGLRRGHDSALLAYLAKRAMKAHCNPIPEFGLRCNPENRSYTLSAQKGELGRFTVSYALTEKPKVLVVVIATPPFDEQIMGPKLEGIIKDEIILWPDRLTQLGLKVQRIKKPKA